MSGTKTAVISPLGHAALSIVFAIIAGKPAERWVNPAFFFIAAANNYIAIPLSTLTILVTFACQVRSSSSRVLATNSGVSTASSHQGALSTRALALQSVVFLALAVLGPFRFGCPRYSYDWDLWVVTEWYPQAGWPCVNNFFVAVGQFLVLDFDSAGRPAGERQALLLG